MSVISPEDAQRHKRDLVRFQAVIMRAVEKADAELDAAEGPEALGAVVSTLHKAGRALRQSMALEVKLARDAVRDDRDAASADARLTEQAVEVRKAKLRHAVERLIWSEHEHPDAELLSAELDEQLDDEARDEGFLDEPLQAQTVRIGRAIGVKGRGGRVYVPAALRDRMEHFTRRRSWTEARSDLADLLVPDGDAHNTAEPEPEASAPVVKPPARRPVRAKPAAAPRTPAARINPDPFNGRLAPPMDPPPWDCDDDSS